MRDFTVYAEETDFPRKAAERIETALQGEIETELPLAVEFTLVDEEEIRRLNRETRGVDKVTDVLSFPSFEALKSSPVRKADHLFELDEEGNLLIGSIAVCEKRAKEQAEEYGHSFERELNYLLTHGIMHCLGYDHETDEEKTEMRKHEESVLERAGIPRTL